MHGMSLCRTGGGAAAAAAPATPTPAHCATTARLAARPKLCDPPGRTLQPASLPEKKGEPETERRGEE